MTPLEPAAPDGSDGPDDRQLCRGDAAYVLGALSAADRRAYEDHLRTCAACQASVRSLAGLPGLLALTSADVLDAPEDQVPPSVLPGVLRRVAQARRRRRRLVGGLAAAGVALLVVAVGALVRPAPVPSAADAGPGPAGPTVTQPAAPPSGTASSGTASSGAASSGPATPDETVTLAQVMPGPMTATLELADRRWGTSITVVCSYSQDMSDSVPYDLAVVDRAGHESSAGSWSGVPGVTARIPAATALPREQISAFEIRLADGRTILQGAP